MYVISEDRLKKLGVDMADFKPLEIPSIQEQIDLAKDKYVEAKSLRLSHCDGMRTIIKNILSCYND
jgi:hypothetical protein